MNPIRVRRARHWTGKPGWSWDCRECALFVPVRSMFGAFELSGGYRSTLAQAADAGRAHCRRRHRQTDYALAN